MDNFKINSTQIGQIDSFFAIFTDVIKHKKLSYAHKHYRKANLMEYKIYHKEFKIYAKNRYS